MSDCRFGVSPVNYPDPDPGAAVVDLQVTLTGYVHETVMNSVQHT